MALTVSSPSFGVHSWALIARHEDIKNGRIPM
jgi:hypothetical protein